MAKLKPNRFLFVLNTRFASTDAKKTCLYDFHLDRGARMEPFAGHSLPIVYKNQTIKSEHMQTRDSASVFDVSHMMQTVIRGRNRCKFIEKLTVADVHGLELNKCTLSMFTNEIGGIIDDCIIAKRSDHLHIVSNAGNADLVWSWLNQTAQNNHEISLGRLSGKGLVALQGPRAAEVLQKLIDIDLRDMNFMTTLDVTIKGIGLCTITRCGYTGEDGFEISVEPKLANSLMDRLCEDNCVKPAGLGARDTLRLEAGLCLHGHDITDKTTPVEAALSWTIHKRRRLEGGFLGSDTILKQLKEGSKVKRVGLKAKKGGPPAREGSIVCDMDDNRELGTITSGTFGPKLDTNIAMAYLPANLATKFGKTVLCNIRGKRFEYELTKMPFIACNQYFKK